MLSNASRLSLMSAAAAAVFAFSFAAPAFAEEVDQEHTSGPSGGLTQNAGASLGQTFTAGSSGDLTSTELSFNYLGVEDYGTAQVEVWAVDDEGLPTGDPLASTQWQSGDIPAYFANELVPAVFDSPAQVSAGSQYAVTVTQSGSGRLAGLTSAPGAYDGGSVVYRSTSTSPWTTFSRDLLFRTFVAAAAQSEPAPAAAAAPNAPQVARVALSFPEGFACAVSAVQASQGSWVQLPGSDLCLVSTPDGATEADLLGWSTDEDFPVEIAQRQVDNGWGAHELRSESGQLTAVFIPAGGHAHITHDGALYPILAAS